MSFTERLGAGAPRKGQPLMTDAEYRDRVKPVPGTREIAAAYQLCNVLYGTRQCSCQKRCALPCDHMTSGVAVVARRLAWWS